MRQSPDLTPVPFGRLLCFPVKKDLKRVNKQEALKAGPDNQAFAGMEMNGLVRAIPNHRQPKIKIAVPGAALARGNKCFWRGSRLFEVRQRESWLF